jgi:hypothetical protein
MLNINLYQEFFKQDCSILLGKHFYVTNSFEVRHRRIPISILRT